MLNSTINVSTVALLFVKNIAQLSSPYVLKVLPYNVYPNALVQEETQTKVFLK